MRITQMAQVTQRISGAWIFLRNAGQQKQKQKRFLVGLAAAALKRPGASGCDDHHNITKGRAKEVSNAC